MPNPNPVPLTVHPGRKKQTQLHTETIQVLHETAPRATKYLKDVSDGKENPNRERIDVCKYIINQTIGTPTNKTEFTGADGGDIIIRVVEDGNGAA